MSNDFEKKEDILIEEAPVEEAPVEEAPVEEAPVEEAPVEEAPVEIITSTIVETNVGKVFSLQKTFEIKNRLSQNIVLSTGDVLPSRGILFVKEKTDQIVNLEKKGHIFVRVV